MAKRRKKPPPDLLADDEVRRLLDEAAMTDDEVRRWLDENTMTDDEVRRWLADLEVAGQPGATDKLACQTAPMTKEPTWTETLRRRARAYLSQRNLGLQVEISRAAVAKFYNGGGLSLNVAEKIGRLFGYELLRPTDPLPTGPPALTESLRWTETLREAAEAKFSQSELARQVGITQSAVSKFYSGGGLSLNVAEKIGRRLGFELAWFLPEDPSDAD